MTKGARQFKEWVYRRFPGKSPQRDAAEYFGWDERTISKLVKGRGTPGLPRAIQIRDETGVPIESWTAIEPVKSVRRRVPKSGTEQLSSGG